MATCTGFQTAVDATTVALGRWPSYAQLTVAFAMFVGGAAGSTAGGIKLVRGLTLAKGSTGLESLSPVGKVTFLFHMSTGRLEIIPVLVMLRTIFKRGGLYG